MMKNNFTASLSQTADDGETTEVSASQTVSNEGFSLGDHHSLIAMQWFLSESTDPKDGAWLTGCAAGDDCVAKDSDTPQEWHVARVAQA